ncbi:hypothetical protein DBR06_SOUSAS12110028, partial [Sousa chinensis]
EPHGPIILRLFGPSAFKGSGQDVPFLSPFGSSKCQPMWVMGLKDSTNQIQEPLWIFPQPLTMTF